MRREDILRECRTAEAMKLGYMGLEGKFANIVRRLGFQIMGHGSGGVGLDQNFLPNIFDEEDDLPYMDEDQGVYEVGWMFEGLRFGCNMTILVKYDDNELVVRWEGRKVYHEIDGSLQAYVPEPEWETKIEELFKIAKRADKILRPLEKKIVEKTKEQEISKKFEDLRNKWGF